MSDALAPLRKLTGPDQVAALRAECTELGRRVARLGAANAEHWLRLAVNMGTSVDMIEKHYGHVKPLQAHKELTARYKI